MPPGTARRLALVAIAALALGCSPGTATFSPSGPCLADGKAPGAFPALERLVPRTFDGRAPDLVDSGRDCTAQALGSLTSRDVAELRFAGATWKIGDAGGVTFAVLARPEAALPVGWVEEFYEAGARAGRRTEHIETSRQTFDGGGPVFRLDTLNDLSFQTVVVWPDGERVRVVLVASSIAEVDGRAEHDAVVAAAFNASFGFVGGD